MSCVRAMRPTVLGMLRPQLQKLFSVTAVRSSRVLTLHVVDAMLESSSFRGLIRCVCCVASVPGSSPWTITPAFVLRNGPRSDFDLSVCSAKFHLKPHCASSFYYHPVREYPAAVWTTSRGTYLISTIAREFDSELTTVAQVKSVAGRNRSFKSGPPYLRRKRSQRHCGELRVATLTCT